MPLSPEHKKRRSKNIALALFLFALVALFFWASIEKMSETGIVAG